MERKFIGQGHRDSLGGLGPTSQRLVDRSNYNKWKGDTASTLASLFSPLSTSLGMYSGDAHGRLIRASNLTPQIMTEVRTAKARGMTDREILQKYGLINDGFGWNKYVPDEIDDALIKSFYGKRHPIGTLIQPNSPTEMSLKDIVRNTSTPDVRFKSGPIPADKSGLVGGLFDYSNLNNPYVALNTREGRKLTELRQSLGHEIQHPHDMIIEQRSFGFNPSHTRDYHRLNAARTSGRSNVSDMEIYAHNAGERRADINGFLATEGPENYRGLQSVYDSLNRNFQYDPRINWGQ